jgi:hypothetical protein
MDGSSLIVVFMPITTLAVLFTGIALPFVAGRSRAGGALSRAATRNRTEPAGKARPPKPGADDAAPVGCLYVPCARTRYHGYLADTHRWVQEVPIVKKTARLIYYTSESWDRARGYCQSRLHQPRRVRGRIPDAAMTVRGISPLAWCALRTAAATATACICWPRAVTAPRLAAADKTAQQTPVASGAQGTGTRGSTARTGKIRAATDTRPA